MNRWTALDWIVTIAPFVILGGIAWAAVRRSTTSRPHMSRFRSVAERRFHEQIRWQ